MADDPEEEEFSGISAPGGGMNPDHPLLQRAQAALKQQLLTNKQRAEEELREKLNSLQDAKAKRETIGVELYGFQQNLAKLQLQLEQTHQDYLILNRARAQAEELLGQLHQTLDKEDGLSKVERAKVEQFQVDMDKLGAMLKQIETYNEEMKSEIAVTRRAAYAAEEQVQKLEKDKKDQDFRIDGAQEQIKQMEQQLALYSAQMDAQKRETRAALETLAEAEAEMESVHFEKKQLVAQWRSSVLAIQKRDEALSAIQDSMRAQQQQELAISSEITGYRRDIQREQVKNEQLTAIVKKVEGEVQFLMKNSEAAVERQGRLQDMMSKLARSLESTEEQIRRVELETKTIVAENEAVERAMTKVNREVLSIEEEMVNTLSEQTTAEKSSGKTVADTLDLRKKIREEELLVVEIQNELAKLQVDVLNTEAHNSRLAETLSLLDEELKEKLRAIDKFDLEIKRRNDDIEKKTREIDHLNRKYEKAVGRMEDEETGPLEATIKNLTNEIDRKGFESQDLQRRWIGWQTELVALQVDNGGLAETVTRMRAEHTVLFQKKRRLEVQLEGHNKEVKDLQSGMGRLHVELQRVNGLIAANSSARQALAEDNFNLENKIVVDLKGMEEEASRLHSHIEQAKQQKRDVLGEIVEVERQIMLWDRKILLEKEMADVIDPTIGQDVVGEMRKEIHRMQLRHTELMRTQEKLMSDLERALSKRDVINIKGRAMNTKKGQEMSKAQLEKALMDLQRSIRDTEKEMVSTGERVVGLEAKQATLAESVATVDNACGELRAREDECKAQLVDAINSRYRCLLATTRHQKMVKRLEDYEAGKYRSIVEDDTLRPEELARSQARQQQVVLLCTQLKESAPHLSPDIDRILCHVLAA